VGPQSKSGDAICLRFGPDLTSRYPTQTVVVIDGGFSGDGARVVEHVRTHYRADKIDLVISTHPDSDHINGLHKVLDDIEVEELWVHKAWDHSQGMADLFSDGRVTDNSLGERLREALNGAHVLSEKATRQGTRVIEPFQGITDLSGSLIVLAPYVNYYEALLLNLLENRRSPSAPASIKEAAARASVYEWPEHETLTDDGEVSTVNNTSVVTLFQYDNQKVLFTADAGAGSLERAIDVLEDDYRIPTSSLNYIQVPHHGSRRNIGPTLLNRLLGRPLHHEEKLRVAFASAAVNGAPKHPSKRVLNAFRRRGAPVWVTAGTHWCISHGVQRAGWGPRDPEPFHFAFEE
jgi:beta-lactamase superfamily II metal-dependent hydrolase